MPLQDLWKYRTEYSFVLAGISLFLISIFAGLQGDTLTTAALLSFLIAFAPLGLVVYRNYYLKKRLEEQFTEFIRDLKESIDSGMTLPLALEHCSKRSYFDLTPYVISLSSQVSWGIPFKKAFISFGKNVGSRTVSKAANTVIEAYDVGGKISETLGAVIDSLATIEKLKREREAAIRSQTLTIYFIFFIFIFILIAIDSFLIPALIINKSEAPDAIGGQFSNSFLQFMLVQGFFSGLVIGKISEGSISAGFKHSLILMLIGYFSFSLSSYLPLKAIFGI